MPETPSPPRWCAAVALVVALWFLVSWSAGLLVDPARLGRLGELEYFLADCVLLLPLALAAFVGLRRRAPWAAPLFLVMAGAVAYSTLHFTVHLIRAQGSGVARVGLAVAVVLLLGALAFLVRRVIRMVAPAGPGG